MAESAHRTRLIKPSLCMGVRWSTFSQTVYKPCAKRKYSWTIYRPKVFANVRAFTDVIVTEIVCRWDSSPTIMVALSSVLTSFCTLFFKTTGILVGSSSHVHATRCIPSWTNKQSQVEPTSNTSMLSILFYLHIWYTTYSLISSWILC
jgi:hypothetical protein